MTVYGQDTGEGKWSKHRTLIRNVAFIKTNDHPFMYVALIEMLARSEKGKEKDEVGNV